MKQILLLFALLSISTISVYGQNNRMMDARQFKSLIDKAIQVGVVYMHENPEALRSNNFLLDSLAIDELDVETSEYTNTALISFTFVEVDGELRFDSLFVKTDFLDSQIPILGIDGKFSYDDAGRFAGYNIIARTGLFNIDFFTLTIKYDEGGRVILNKSVGAELTGGEVFGDSIVYTIDGEGFVRAWDRFDLSESNFRSESYKEITYGEDGIMNSYIQDVYLNFGFFDTLSTRYTDVVFYEPSIEQSHAIKASTVSPTGEFLPISDINPLTELRDLQINNNVEVWENEEWVLQTTRTFEYRGDTLVTFTEEQPNVFISIEEFAFNADGSLESRTVTIDPIVVPLTPESRIRYEYDSNGNITFNISEFFAEGGWIENDRTAYEYEYDDNNNISELRIFNIFEGATQFGERYRIWIAETSVSTTDSNIAPYTVGMFPNPVAAESTLVISGLDGEMVDILLSDMSGKIIVNQKLFILGDKMNKALQFSDIPSGNYILTVSHPSGKVGIPLIKQ